MQAAQEDLRKLCYNGLTELVLIVKEWIAYNTDHPLGPDKESEELAYKLLAEHLVNLVPNEHGLMSPTTPKMFRFSRSLFEVQKFLRRSSKPSDYVLAVWIDCPGFEVPPEYDLMSLAELLEDAVQQLRIKVGVEILTYAPPGLFGEREAAKMTWHPAQYLYAIPHPDNIQEVYGSRLIMDHGEVSADILHSFCLLHNDIPARQ